MKTLVKISVYMILIFIVYTLTEANAKILSFTNQVYFDFLGESSEEYLSIAKALAYSLATVIIVIYYENLFTRLLFIILDGFIVFVYHFVDKDVWHEYSSYYYAILTALIFGFIGFIAHKYYKEDQKRARKIRSSGKLERNNKKIDGSSFDFPDNLEYKKMKLDVHAGHLKSEMLKLKRTGKNGGPYTDYPDRVKRMNEFEKELRETESQIEKISVN